jgi:hypothetical protein
MAVLHFPLVLPLDVRNYFQSEKGRVELTTAPIFQVRSQTVEEMN